MRQNRAKQLSRERPVTYLDNNWLEAFNAQRNTNLERPDWVGDSVSTERLYEVEPHPPRPEIKTHPSTKASHPGGSRIVSIPEMQDLVGWRYPWYQREVILSEAPFLVFRAARRCGKDVSCVTKAVYEGMKRRGTIVILYPTESQAMNSIIYGTTSDGDRLIEKIIPRNLVQHYVKEGKMCYRYPNKNRAECILANGSKIRWLSVHNQGKKLVGDNWTLAIFSEAAHIKNLHAIYYDQVAPILSKSGGRVVFQATHHDDGDEFDQICRTAEREKDIRMPDGRLKWHLVTVTPRDYMTREQEWELEAQYAHDRPALARHFYQKRGYPSIKDSIIGQWLQGIEYQPDLLLEDHPVFCVWDIGGSCNTAIWIMQVTKDGKPPRFMGVITGNRKTDPNQSTLYYLDKVRDRLGDHPHVLHITPHDSTAKKNLDHVLTPYDILWSAGAKVFRAPRAKSKPEAIQTMIEYLREHKLMFDEEAREGVLSLCRVKWKSVNGVIVNKPELTMELDCFDAFLYCILLLVGKYQRTPENLVSLFFPQYLWPHERNKQDKIIPNCMLHMKGKLWR